MIDESGEKVVTYQKPDLDLDLSLNESSTHDEAVTFWSGLYRLLLEKHSLFQSDSSDGREDIMIELVESLKPESWKSPLPFVTLEEFQQFPHSDLSSEMSRHYDSMGHASVAEKYYPQLTKIINSLISSRNPYEAFNMIIVLFFSQSKVFNLNEEKWYPAYQTLIQEYSSEKAPKKDHFDSENMTSTPVIRSRLKKDKFFDSSESFDDQSSLSASKKRVRFSLGPDHVSADLEESLGGRSNRIRLNDLSRRRQNYLKNNFTFFSPFTLQNSHDSSLLGRFFSRLFLFVWYIFTILCLLVTVSSVFSLLSIVQKSLLSTLFEYICSSLESLTSGLFSSADINKSDL